MAKRFYTPKHWTMRQRLEHHLKWDGDCLIFVGPHHPYGYGQFNFEGKAQRAHRVAYELAKGQIPKGLNVLHSCDRPSCCNPDHLRLGTQKDNSADCWARGRARMPEKHQITGRPRKSV